MTFLYLNSDKMGEGDPELGQKLLVIFLHEWWTPTATST